MVVRIIPSFAVAAFLSASLTSAQDIDAAKQMKRDVGDWNVVIKMFRDPSGASVLSKGTETRFMLGDMWLISHFKGEIMGTRFEGLRQTGFDLEKKRFIASWVDSTSRFPTHTDGTWDEKTQTMSSIGTGRSPSGDEMKTKMVVSYNEDGSHTLTMYAIMRGEQMKMMEFHYTRVADKPGLRNTTLPR
jgi:hypothetical protein